MASLSKVVEKQPFMRLHKENKILKNLNLWFWRRLGALDFNFELFTCSKQPKTTFVICKPEV